MKARMLVLLYLPLVLAISITAAAQNWAGVLDPTRAIDWTQAGIPGGIPNRTAICSTSACNALSALATGTGAASSNTSLISSALSSAPANSVVLLPAGTWSVTNISVPTNVTLRGQGTQQTILDGRGTSGPMISLGSGTPSLTYTSTNIKSGATANSTSITVASASGISVGSYLLISELNDSTYVTISVPNGTCTWCDGYWSGTRARGQIVEVTSVSGSTIGIAPGLYSAYTQTPMASYFSAGAKYAGLENVQLYGNNTGYNPMISFSTGAYCWVKGVEINYADGDMIDTSLAFRGEIRDSYFSNAYVHSSGSVDSDLMLGLKTTGFLVENNIFERLHSSVITNWGAAGNVIAFNYSTGAFDVSNTYAVQQDFTTGHGAHPQFNLWEGNVTPEINGDAWWGSGSHSTLFRNWAQGTTLYAPPSSGRGTINWGSGYYQDRYTRPINIAWTHTKYNIVANVSGSAAATTTVGASALYNAGGAPYTSYLLAPSTRYAGCHIDQCFFPAFNVGYDTTSDSNGSNVPSAWWVGGVVGGTTLAWSTALVHGNYDTASNAVIWNGTTTTTLPASFFRNSKPQWWGASIPWPAIGPDVAGGTGPGGHTSLTASNPAQACYNSTARNSNGILLFDPSVCYVSSGVGGAPSSPTGLNAVVH